MEDTKTDAVVFTNYKSGRDFETETREIKSVEFHESNLDEIPAQLLDHTELESVAFNDCRFTGIENLEQLKVCQNLTQLTLKECNLQMFPNFLSELHTLDNLNLSGNSFKAGLPDSMRNLQNLETLDISSCMLQGFPLVLNKLRKLKMLNIEGNQVVSLSESLENLRNLKTLNVSNCGLTEFPEVLCKLKSLTALDIAGNNITVSIVKGFPGTDRRLDLPDTLENLTNLKTLNVSKCGLREFPEVLCKLKSLNALYISRNPLTELSSRIFEMKRWHKLDISNTSITHLPKAIERCESLKQLDISNNRITEFPTVIFKVKNLSSVVATSVLISVLDEDFVKLWSQRPEIFTKGRFQKMVGLPTVNFLKPPDEIVRRGPEACMKYYRALKADDAVNSSILNVSVIGKTGAGKSSLIHSIKEGSSVLDNPSDSTVVVDTLEVKQEDILLKITDFGGQDIYEMTYPLFLKSTKQVAIVAVKLSEYNENNHSKIVTKWLTTAASHMKSGSIYIVATQCDLCPPNEMKKKMSMLKRQVNNWLEEELSFTTKMGFYQPITARKGALNDRHIEYFQTSSLNMEGMEDIKEFLFREAKSDKSVFPKHWADVYKKMDEKADKNFIQETWYQTLFRKTMPFPRNLFPNIQESLQCLQFLHDTGMILWYGEKNLKNIIFHNPSFLVSVLQCLFRHDLVEVSEYDHDKFGTYFPSKSKFQHEVTRFTQTGILNPLLLKCIWKKFEFSQDVFETMVEMLTMLDLCYIDGQGTNGMLRMPWFVQDEDMSFLHDFWPKKLPPGMLQYTLTYCFCHWIPGVIYERFCVRLQRHLPAGAHTRHDSKDGVYVEQNGVQIFFQRHQHEFEPYMQIHLRCSIWNLLRLQRVFLALHQDMGNLCSEYSGLYIDSYFLCPHCLLVGSMTPTQRSVASINEKVSLQWVPCDPFTPGSVQIPAALIFLRLFGKFLSLSFG